MADLTTARARGESARFARLSAAGARVVQVYAERPDSAVERLVIDQRKKLVARRAELALARRAQRKVECDHRMRARGLIGESL